MRAASTRWLTVAASLCAIAALPACGGASGTASSSSADKAPSSAPSSAPSQPPPPPPETAGERRWRTTVTAYATRYTRWYDGQGGSQVITDATMEHDIGLAAACRPALRKAGAPGRYRPARRIAAGACAQLARAAGALRKAMAVSVNGTTESGDAQQAFSKALDRSLEATGNARNDFTRLTDEVSSLQVTFG